MTKDRFIEIVRAAFQIIDADPQSEITPETLGITSEEYEIFISQVDRILQRVEDSKKLLES